MAAIGAIGCAIAVFGISAMASVATMTWTPASPTVHGDGRVVLAGLEASPRA